MQLRNRRRQRCDGRVPDTGTADLLVCDLDLPGDPLSLIRDARHASDSLDPFIPVIVVGWRPDREIVSKIVESGADSLLRLPVGGPQLAGTVDTLVHARKPFVVTSDYIRPDRHSGSDNGNNNVETIEVPNPLRGRITGSDERAKYEEALGWINDHRIESCALEIRTLTGYISEHYDHLVAADEMAAQLRRLRHAGIDMAHRVVGTRYSHLEEVCRGLVKIIGDLEGVDMRAQKFDRGMFEQVVLAMRTTFASTDDDVANAAEKVAA